mgnify:CR=1 FL=1
MNKFNRILVLFSSLIVLISFSSCNNCGVLKNNTFTYRYSNKDVIVIFNENRHIEYHNNQEFYIKSDIEWINNCEYYLTINEYTLPNFPFKIGDKMHVVINKVRGKKIYYTSSLGGSSWEGRLTKIKNQR